MKRREADRCDSTVYASMDNLSEKEPGLKRNKYAPLLFINATGDSGRVEFQGWSKQ